MAIEDDVYNALRTDPKLRNKVFEVIREATSAHPMYDNSVQGKTDYSIDLHPAADSLTDRQLQIVHLAQPLYKNGRLVKKLWKGAAVLVLAGAALFTAGFYSDDKGAQKVYKVGGAVVGGLGAIAAGVAVAKKK